MKNVAFIPKQLFGEEGIVQDIGPIGAAIIVGLSRRTNSQRNMATASIGLIMQDFNINITNSKAKNKIKKGLEFLCDCNLIEVDNISKCKVNDAFDAYLYYDLIPFVKLYDHEFAMIIKHGKDGMNNVKLMMIFLYVVSHISEKTKKPTWVTVENIAEHFNMNVRTVSSYLYALTNDIGVLYKQGKKKTYHGHSIQLYNRNITEYIHQHREKLEHSILHKS